MLQDHHARAELDRYEELPFVDTVFARADERETNQNNHGFDRNKDGIKAMLVVGDVDGVYQRN